MTDTTTAAQSIRCAMCLTPLPRWYFGMRAPLCVFCFHAEGPVHPPARWGSEGTFVNAPAAAVWRSYVPAEAGAPR